ncbi:MAG: hypothetical protein FIB01_00090, partial [Gemmatimonadetes bacterium]|nr:hypothetical protein [Gemmatimonadota bacterium]
MLARPDYFLEAAMLRRNLAILALLLPALGGCADNPLVPSDPGPVQVSGGAATSDYVGCGTMIPVTATAGRDGGRPYPNLLLNFNVLAGGGSMFGGAGITNGKGVARDIWTIGGGANRLNTIAVRAVDATTGVGTQYFTQTVTTLSKIAFKVGFTANSDIFVMDADGSHLTNLTNDGMWDETPAWSPDGRRIAFGSLRVDSPGGGDSGFEIYVMNADGSNVTRLTNNAAQDRSPSWAPDGSKIAFKSDRDAGPYSFQIYVMNADGSNQKRLTNSKVE